MRSKHQRAVGYLSEYTAIEDYVLSFELAKLGFKTII